MMDTVAAAPEWRGILNLSGLPAGGAAPLAAARISSSGRYTAWAGTSTRMIDAFSHSSIGVRKAMMDLLFTDVIMPGSISSSVLGGRAAELRPGLKILFTSGYTENTIVHNGRLDPGVQLLSKPYGRDQLARKVHTILARPEGVPGVPKEINPASAGDLEAAGGNKLSRET